MPDPTQIQAGPKTTSSIEVPQDFSEYAIGAADINLRTPLGTTGDRGPARKVVVIEGTGTMNVVTAGYPNGIRAATLLVVGSEVTCQINTIKGSAAGTTVTRVRVYR